MIISMIATRKEEKVIVNSLDKRIFVVTYFDGDRVVGVFVADTKEEIENLKISMINDD